MFVIARILTTIALFHLAFCMELPAPVDLALSSQYFVHSLSWKMGPGCPDGVHYTVRVQKLSDSKVVVVVKDCEKVTFPLQCNLTEAFSDVEETYYVSVSAALGNRTSQSSDYKAFKPIRDTILEPPLLTVTTCNQSLCVSLRAPAEKLYRFYNSFKFQYRLMVSSEDGSEFHVDTEGLKSVTLEDLAPGRRYCVNVSIIDRSPPNRWVCASTPKRANVSDAIISVILCLLMVLIVMCTPRYVSRRLCLKNLPLVLSSFQKRDKVLLNPADEPINNLCVERDSIQKMKRNREEKDIEGETEEGLKHERLEAHYLDTQGSPLTVFPMNQTPDTSLTSSTDDQSCSLIVFEGSHIHTEPTASPRLPQRTSPLQNSSSIFSTPVENEDRENNTDVNLFSVMLGAVSSEQHKPEPDKTCYTEDEQEPCPQSLLQTSATFTWISDSQSQNSESIQKNILDEEDDDDLGYLSRN
ncbi:cytokine receptor family member b2 [Garra rufa]|uniref:cytokine receptor family member b2 n=1 Tax=Garra rufa TaxID=137080 RepID=UPI003CCEBE19